MIDLTAYQLNTGACSSYKYIGEFTLCLPAGKFAVRIGALSPTVCGLSCYTGERMNWQFSSR